MSKAGVNSNRGTFFYKKKVPLCFTCDKNTCKIGNRVFVLVQYCSMELFRNKSLFLFAEGFASRHSTNGNIRIYFVTIPI